MINLLDQGYVKLIETWGSDERIIESARMSTNKPFEGWGPKGRCQKCGAELVRWGDHMGLLYHDTFPPDGQEHHVGEKACGGEVTVTSGDEKLLAYLYKNRHMTPFEMAGATFEVKAPIMVFREWHRHRTQSYNEMSARYVPLPAEDYLPTMDRIRLGVQMAKQNRQAQGAVELNQQMATAWLDHLERLYEHAQSVYEMGINAGVPKELARLAVTVGRYSRMRVSTDLRNWLGFCDLRDTAHGPGAQWEIRQYADTVNTMLTQAFPRTLALFNGGAK